MRRSSGSSSFSPARETPPPTITVDGFRIVTADAMPLASRCEQLVENAPRRHVAAVRRREDDLGVDRVRVAAGELEQWPGSRRLRPRDGRGGRTRSHLRRARTARARPVPRRRRRSGGSRSRRLRHRLRGRRRRRSGRRRRCRRRPGRRGRRRSPARSHASARPGPRDAPRCRRAPSRGTPAPAGSRAGSPPSRRAGAPA